MIFEILKVRKFVGQFSDSDHLVSDDPTIPWYAPRIRSLRKRLLVAKLSEDVLGTDAGDE